MVNPIQYVKNVGRSLGYMAVEKFEEKNPALKALREENQELVKDVYKSVKNWKSTSSNVKDKALKSDVGMLAKDFTTNLIDDIRTGKFYNKEREEAIENEMFESFGGGFDDFDDMDFEDNDSGDDNLDFDFDEGFDDLEDTIDDVGSKTSKAISEVTARSAEYIVSNEKYNTSALLQAHNEGIHRVMTGINSINGNLVGINNIGETLTTHSQNAATFFTKSNQFQDKMIEMMEKVVKNTSPVEKEYKRDENAPKTVRDILGSEDTLDIKAFIDNAIRNVKEEFSMISSMNDMFKDENGNGASVFKMFTASPVKMLMEGMIDKVIPQVIDESMKNFNQILNGFFGSLIMKINNTDSYGDGILNKVLSFFKVNNKFNTKMDTGQYMKGKVDFDGKTRKAIVEVIPTYLSKILTVLSGGEETRYNYDTGKFIKMSELDKEMDRKIQSNADMAGWDLRDKFSEYTNGMNNQNEMMDNLSEFFRKSMETGKMFNYRDPNVKDQYRDFGLNEVTGNALVAMLKDLEAQGKGGYALDYNKEILNARESTTDMIRSESEKGDSVFSSLYNNSFGDKGIFGAKSSSVFDLNTIFDDKHNNIFFYLQGIYQFTQHVSDNIGNIVSGGGDGSGGRKRRGPKKPRGGGGPTINPIRDIQDNTPEEEPDDRYQNEDYTKSSYDKFVEPVKNDKKYTTKVISYEDYMNLSQNEKDDYIAEINNLKRVIERKNKNKKKKGLHVPKFMQNSKTGKALQGVLDGVSDAVSVPAQAMADMMTKTGNRLLDIIYGKELDEEGKEAKDKGFFPYLMYRMNETFNNIDTWIHDKVLEPLKEKLNIKNAGDLARKIFGLFGVDYDNLKAELKDIKEDIVSNIFGEKNENGQREGGALSDIYNGVKENFGKVKDWAKDSYKSTLGQFFFRKKKYNRGEGTETPEEGEGQPSAATGGRVTKSGMIAVSKGELVIPSEYNPFYHGTTDKEGQKRNESNIVKRFFGKFNNGGTADEEQDPETAGDVKEDESAPKKGEKKKDYWNRIKNAAKKTYGDNEDPSIIKQSIDEFINGFKTFKDKLFGTEEEQSETTKKVKETTSDFLKEAKIPKNISSMVTGGILGIGGSILTGGLISPMMGAALGSASGLIISSDKVKEALFGNQEEGKEGLLPQEVADFVQKKLPTMAKFGFVGSTVSLLPFIPGGPVTGLILGSSIGFAAQSDKIKTAIFGNEKDGEKGLISKELQDKIKKAAPRMGAGIIGMMLAPSPFGLVGNVIIGSAVGFASTTEKFQKALFGENKDGKGGLIGWIKEEIFSPLSRAFRPITKELQIKGKTIVKTIQRSIKNMFKNTIWTPMQKKLEEYLYKPIGGIVKKLTSPISKMIKAPFQAIGKYGDYLRRKQIRNGEATYMTAAERLQYRKDHDMDRTAADKRKDKSRSFDEALVNMDEDQMNIVKEYLNNIEDPEKALRNQMNDRISQVNRSLADFDSVKMKDIHRITSRLKDNNVEKALEYVNGMEGIDDESRSFIANMIQEQGKEINSLAEKRKDVNGFSTEVRKKLFKEFGIKIDEKNAWKYQDLIDAEMRARNKGKAEQEEPLSPAQQEVVNRMDTLIKYIKIIAGEDPDKAEKETENAAKNNGEDNSDNNNDQTPTTPTSTGPAPGQDPEEWAAEVYQREEGVFDRLRQRANDLKFSAQDLKDQALHGAGQVVSGVAHATGDIISGTAHAAGLVGRETVQTVRNGMAHVGNGVDYVRNMEGSDCKNLWENMKNLKEFAKSIGHGIAEYIKKDVSEAGSNLKRFFGGSREEEEPTEETATAATGGNVTKSGMIAVSEGELVIPSEYNPFYHGTTDKEAQKKNESNIVKRFFGKFAEGGTVETAGEVQSDESTPRAGETTREYIDRVQEAATANSQTNADSAKEAKGKSYTVTSAGEVIQQVKNPDGELAPDLADSKTKKAIANQKEIADAQKQTPTLLMMVNDSINNLAGKLIGDKKEKKGGLLGKLFGFLSGGLLKFVKKGALKLLGKAGTFIKTKVLGKFAEWFSATGIGQLFKDGLSFFTDAGFKTAMKGVFKSAAKSALIAVGLKKFLEKNSEETGSSHSTQDAIADTAVQTVTGEDKMSTADHLYFGRNKDATITDSEGNVHHISLDKNGDPILDKDGNYVDQNGKSTGVTEEEGTDYKETVAGKTFNDRFKQGAARELLTGKKSLAGVMVRKGVKEVKNIGTNLKAANKVFRKSNFGKTLRKSKFGKTVRKGILKTKSAVRGFKKTNKALTSTTKVGKAVETFANSKTMGTILDGVKSALDKLPDIFNKIPILKNYSGSVGSIASALFEKVQKVLTKSAPELIEKISAQASKLVPVIGWAVAIAAAVKDFFDGYQDARTTFSITTDPTTGQKIISGMINMIKNLIPVIGVLLPSNAIIDLFVNHIAPLMGLDMEELKKNREDAKAEVEEYNKEHGTDLNIEEYNKQVKGHWTTSEKVSNAVKSAGKNIKKGVKNFGKGAKKKISQAGNWVKDKASGAVKGAKNLGKKAKEGLSNAGEWIGDKASAAWEGIQDVGSNIGKFADDKIVTPFVKFKDNLAKAMETSHAQVQKALSKEGKIQDMFDFSSMKMKDGPLTGIAKGALVVERFMYVGSLIFKNIGGKIVDGFKSVIKAVKSNASSAFESFSEINSIARSGDTDKLADYEFQADENDPTNGFQKGVVSVAKLIFTPKAYIHKAGNWLGKKFREVFKSVKANLLSSFESFAEINSIARSGDTDKLADYEFQADENDPTNGFQKGVVSVLKFMLTPKAYIHKAGNWIRDKFKEAVNVVKTNGSSAIESITEIQSIAKTGDTDKLADYEFQADEDDPVNGFQSGIVSISKIMYTPNAYMHKMGNAIADWFKDKVSDAKKAADFSTSWKQIKKLSSDTSTKLGDIWDYKSDIGKNNSFAWLNTVGTFFQKLIGTAYWAFNQVAKPIKELGKKVQEKWGDVKETAGKVVDGAKNTVKKGVNAVKSGANAVADGAKNVADGAVDLANGAWNKVKSIAGYGSGMNSNGTFVSQLGDNSKYGSSTMEKEGCAPAAAAMVVNKASGNKVVSMKDTAAYARKRGYEMNGGTSADYFGDIFSQYGMGTDYTQNEDEMFNRIMSGQPTVLLGRDGKNKSKKNSPFGPQNHYVVAEGVDSTGNLIINDPEQKQSKKYSKSILDNVSIGMSARPSGSGSRVGSAAKKVIRKIPILRRFVGGGLRGGTTEEQVFNFFIDNGFSAAAAAGATGNMMEETGWDHIDTKAVESNGEGVGIVQWSFGRKTAFLNYCQSIGKPFPEHAELEVQLQYVLKECRGDGVENQWISSDKYGPYKMSFDEFIKLTDPNVAAGAFCAGFERPSVALAHLDQRQKNAVTVYNAYSGNEPVAYDGGNISSTTTSDGESSSESSSPSIEGLFSNLFSAAYGKEVGSLFGLSSDDSSSSTSANSTTSVTSSGVNTSSINPDESAPELAKQVAAEAATYVGKIPYVFGGTSLETGIDCSGFTQAMMQKYGLQIPRTAADQASSDATGTPISRDQARTGDLVYFQNTYKPGVSHTGIMLNHNDFVHAKSTKDGIVITNDLDNSSYNSHIHSFRRPSIYGAGSGLTDTGMVTKSDRSNLIQFGDYATDVQVRTKAQTASRLLSSAKSDNAMDEIVSLIRSIVSMLSVVASNSDQLQTIAKLLSNYIKAKEKDKKEKVAKESQGNTKEETKTKSAGKNTKSKSSSATSSDDATQSLLSYLDKLASGQ